MTHPCSVSHNSTLLPEPAGYLKTISTEVSTNSLWQGCSNHCYKMTVHPVLCLLLSPSSFLTVQLNFKFKTTQSTDPSPNLPQWANMLLLVFWNLTIAHSTKLKLLPTLKDFASPVITYVFVPVPPSPILTLTSMGILRIKLKSSLLPLETAGLTVSTESYTFRARRVNLEPHPSYVRSKV